MILFNRSSENLVMVNSHLLNVLGKQSLDVSAWAMNHASMTPTDEAFLMTRKNEYSLWLTTPRMLLGESQGSLLFPKIEFFIKPDMRGLSFFFFIKRTTFL